MAQDTDYKLSTEFVLPPESGHVKLYVNKDGNFETVNFEGVTGVFNVSQNTSVKHSKDFKKTEETKESKVDSNTYKTKDSPNL